MFTYDLDSNEPFNVEDNHCVKFINVNEQNISKIPQLLSISDKIDDIILRGKLDHLDIPILNCELNIDCSEMGLKTLYVPDNVIHLFCNDNQLEYLEVPHGIWGLGCENNNIKQIKFRGGDPYTLGFLNMRNNKITNFDAKLPNTLWNLLIEGNPNIKIKYLDAIIIGRMYIIEGDFDEVLFENKLKYNEYLKLRLYDMCQNGFEYITLQDIEKYRIND